VATILIISSVGKTFIMTGQLSGEGGGLAPHWRRRCSPDLSPLDYQFWGQCWSLITNSDGSQKRFPSLVCLTGESHWQLCERHVC